jgi:hypothetical protein
MDVALNQLQEHDCAQCMHAFMTDLQQHVAVIVNSVHHILNFGVLPNLVKPIREALQTKESKHATA